MSEDNYEMCMDHLKNEAEIAEAEDVVHCKMALSKRSFNEGIECAARKIEAVMEHSPKYDRELLAKCIRGLAL